MFFQALGSVDGDGHHADRLIDRIPASIFATSMGKTLGAYIMGARFP